MKSFMYRLQLIIAVLFTGSAQAAVISSTGPVDIIAAPASVELNVLESDTQIRVFDEKQDVVLASDIVTNGGPDGQFTPNTLLTGTQLSSHLVHVDPVQATSLNEIFNATITFDGRIAGLIWMTGDLINTDSLFGLDGTLYENGVPSRGAGNAVPGSDIFYVSLIDPNVLVIEIIPTGNREGLGGMDEIRVLTYVPVPAALWLFISGIAVVFSLNRSRA